MNIKSSLGKVGKTRWVRIGVLVIIVCLVGAAAYLIKAARNQSADKVVETVLQDKQNISLSDEKMKKYFTEEYLKRSKQTENKSQTAVHKLSTRPMSSGYVVTMTISWAGTKGSEDTPVADFYLNKKGTLFSRHLVISDIIERSPLLSGTIRDLLAKKEEVQVAAGEKFSPEDGWELRLGDFSKSNQALAQEETAALYETNLSIEKFPAESEITQLFFRLEDEQGQSCSSWLAVNKDSWANKTVPLKFTVMTPDCQVKKVRLGSLAPIDIVSEVKIKNAK